jgi:PhoH-like ATPase
MQDPHCIGKIEGDIYLPIVVLEELDKHKNDNNEIGKNCREFARILSKIDDLYPDRVIFLTHPETAPQNSSNDVKIIFNAKEEGSILLTNDLMMQGLARAYNVKCEAYHGVTVSSTTEAYEGIREASNFDDLQPNEYVVGGGLIERFDGENLKKIGKDRKVFGIGHKNLEQKCALDALMDDSIKLVTINGKAGTGKTMLAIAAGLEKVLNENKYNKVLISRPTIAMGEEIGFLPGDINEKMGPWMQPIFDNIEFLFGLKAGDAEGAIVELQEKGIVKIQALTYIRGRSIPNEFILIDEAQNLTKHEVKTILTRAGENTKIIMVGDIEQIDHPKLDSVNNGLSYVIEKFKDQKIAAHITLKKTERSELADISSKIL